jgi:uncharacterized protein (TIGR03083 family)
MTRLEHESYLAHIGSESRLFRDALTDVDPGARVPACPDWSADDLLWHLGGVQDFWARVVEGRPEQPTEDEAGQDSADRPGSHEGLLAFFDASHERMMTALAGLPPTEPAWTWSSDPADHTVGFIYRRQAHEALIHRVDAQQTAQQTAGTSTDIDALLAADGVEECLDVMYGGCPPWGSWSPLPHYVRFDMSDVDESVWVQLGRFSGTDPDGVSHEEEDLHVVPDPGQEPDAVIEAASAAALDLRLWKRGPGDDFHLAGDRSMVARVRAITHAPIN